MNEELTHFIGEWTNEQRFKCDNKAWIYDGYTMMDLFQFGRQVPRGPTTMPYWNKGHLRNHWIYPKDFVLITWVENDICIVACPDLRSFVMELYSALEFYERNNTAFEFSSVSFPTSEEELHRWEQVLLDPVREFGEFPVHLLTQM